jgi:hypothetical protein
MHPWLRWPHRSQQLRAKVPGHSLIVADRLFGTPKTLQQALQAYGVIGTSHSWPGCAITSTVKRSSGCRADTGKCGDRTSARIHRDEFEASANPTQLVQADAGSAYLVERITSVCATLACLNAIAPGPGGR